MNKNLIWAVVGVVVLGALIYFMMGNDTSAPSDNTDEQAEQNEVENVSSGSFRELLASGASQRCTFEDPESGSEGTMYVSGGRMRGDFTTTTNSVEANSHMVVKDNTFYMWTDGETQGFKMNVDASTQADVTQGQLDLDQEVNYDCDTTSVSDGQFDLPANVTFSDFSSFGL